METDLYLKLTGLIVAAIAGIGGIFVFVIKGIIGKQISKDLEKFKVRFSRLHEEQARAIRDLYGSIVEVEEDVVNLYYKYMPIGLNPPYVDEVEVIKRMRNLQLMFIKSRIYLDDKTTAAVSRVCNHLSAAVSSLEQRRMFLDSDPDGQSGVNDDLEMAAFQEIKEQVPEAKEVLEKEFKRLLGNSQ